MISSTKEHERTQRGGDLILAKEVYAIVGAALEVRKELGVGFLEAVYQEALGIEFAKRDIPFVPQRPLRITYKGATLSKEYIADFVCYDQIIVELKAIRELTGGDTAQLLNYLKATGWKLGILFNFGCMGELEWKRVVS